MNNYTIYALHGFLGKGSDWDILFSSSLVAQHLKTVEFFKDDFTYSFQEWAERFNLDVNSQRVNKRILMGYSMGGRLAMHALLRQPALWDAAVIISAHPGLRLANERQKRKLSDEEWATRFESEPWDNLMQAWNQHPVFAGSYEFERHEHDFDRKKLANAMRTWSLANQDNLLPKLNKLSMPILWVGGDLDPQSSYLKKLTLKHPFSKVWSAPKAGHRTPWQQPDQFMNQLTNFIQNAITTNSL